MRTRVQTQVKSCQFFWHHNCCAYSVRAYEPVQVKRYLVNLKDIWNQGVVRTCVRAYELLQVKSCQIFWHHFCCAYSVHAYEPLQRRYLGNLKDICNQKVVCTCVRTRSSQELSNFLASQLLRVQRTCVRTS